MITGSGVAGQRRALRSRRAPTRVLRVLENSCGQPVSGMLTA